MWAINIWIENKQIDSIIHLIVGNTGSGKTTYSNTLKKDINTIVFSIA